MKHLFILILLSSVLISQNQDLSQVEPKTMTLNIRGGADIGGDITFRYLLTDLDDDPEMGYTIGADLVIIKSKYFDLGAGYEMQLKRGFDEIDGKMGFNSFHFLIETETLFARFSPKNNFHGDNIFTSGVKLEGDWTLCTGIRFRINDSIMELSSSTYWGNIDFGDGDEMSVEYRTYNVSFGYAFDFPL